MRSRKYTSTQPGEGPQSSSQFSQDQLGQAGSLLKNTSQWLLAGWPFWSGARPEFSSSVTLEGSLAAVKPPGALRDTVIPTVLQNTDLPGSRKQHRAILPNPLSMHLKKALVRIELYFIQESCWQVSPLKSSISGHGADAVTQFSLCMNKRESRNQEVGISQFKDAEFLLFGLLNKSLLANCTILTKAMFSAV